MTTFLVDFENVHHHGLTGIDKLSAEDYVVIFLGKTNLTINLDAAIAISKTSAHVIWKRSENQGKNYLDIQLASYLGSLVGENKVTDFRIISKDHGFLAAVDFWRERRKDITITMQESIGKGSSDVKQLMPPVTPLALTGAQTQSASGPSQRNQRKPSGNRNRTDGSRYPRRNNRYRDRDEDNSQNVQIVDSADNAGQKLPESEQAPLQVEIPTQPEPAAVIEQAAKATQAEQAKTQAVESAAETATETITKAETQAGIAPVQDFQTHQGIGQFTITQAPGQAQGRNANEEEPVQTQAQTAPAQEAAVLETQHRSYGIGVFENRKRTLEAPSATPAVPQQQAVQQSPPQPKAAMAETQPAQAQPAPAERQSSPAPKPAESQPADKPVQTQAPTADLSQQTQEAQDTQNAASQPQAPETTNDFHFPDRTPQADQEESQEAAPQPKPAQRGTAKNEQKRAPRNTPGPARESKPKQTAQKADAGDVKYRDPERLKPAAKKAASAVLKEYELVGGNYKKIHNILRKSKDEEAFLKAISAAYLGEKFANLGNDLLEAYRLIREGNGKSSQA